MNTKFGKLIVGRGNQKLESLFPAGVALKLECEPESQHRWLGHTPEFPIQQKPGGSSEVAFLASPQVMLLPLAQGPSLGTHRHSICLESVQGLCALTPACPVFAVVLSAWSDALLSPQEKGKCVETSSLFP